MPRKSPYVITLSRQEREILESRARKYTLPYFEVLRAKMILLAAEGWGNDEIASRSVGRPRRREPVAQTLLPRTPAAGWRSARARADPRFFPPELVVQVKALACELPATLRPAAVALSTADIVREAQRCGIVATISDKTVWRWLHEDAIRPWQHRSWIFPRDPDSPPKRGASSTSTPRHWQGKRLHNPTSS